MDAEFVIAVDSREQRPWTFRSIRSDAKDGRERIKVATQRTTLAAGDYSILGLEDEIAIERKSLQDLYQSVGRNHARFRREAERLATYKYAAVIVECSQELAFLRPPVYSQVHPKIPGRVSARWSCVFGINWWYCGAGTNEFIEAIGDSAERIFRAVQNGGKQAMLDLEELAKEQRKMYLGADSQIARKSRVFAERWCYRLLDNYWRLNHDTP